MNEAAPTTAIMMNNPTAPATQRFAWPAESRFSVRSSAAIKPPIQITG
jgi:hypothetical protein